VRVNEWRECCLFSFRAKERKWTPISVNLFSFALKENKQHSLHSLTLTYNSLNIQKFRGNVLLLNCHRKKYYDFDAIIIASLVSCNASLRRLILTENYIGDKGAKAIASALNCNNVLQFLDLSGNMIGDLGVSAMNTVRTSLKVVLKNMRVLDKCSVS
jgi:Ran GTPase-activating protein (RanGAP) involved in mRNA processing and transport